MEKKRVLEVYWIIHRCGFYCMSDIEFDEMSISQQTIDLQDPREIYLLRAISIKSGINSFLPVQFIVNST